MRGARATRARVFYWCSALLVLVACALGWAVLVTAAPPDGWTGYQIGDESSYYLESTGGLDIDGLVSPVNDQACTDFYMRVRIARYAGFYNRYRWWVTRDDTEATVIESAAGFSQLGPPGVDSAAWTANQVMGCGFEDVPLTFHVDVEPLDMPMRAGFVKVEFAVRDATHNALPHKVTYEAAVLKAKKTPTPTPTPSPTPSPTCPPGGSCSLTEAQGVDFVNGIETAVVLLAIGIPCLVAMVTASVFLFFRRG